MFVYYWYKKKMAEPVVEEEEAGEEDGDYEGVDGEEAEGDWESQQ